jgi:hypothetical protein
MSYGPNIGCMWSEGTSPAAQSGVQRTPKVPSPEFNFVWYPMREGDTAGRTRFLCSKTGAEKGQCRQMGSQECCSGGGTVWWCGGVVVVPS